VTLGDYHGVEVRTAKAVNSRPPPTTNRAACSCC
jgi:hypothetical protein